jgi:hypothetical protein
MRVKCYLQGESAIHVVDSAHGTRGYNRSEVKVQSTSLEEADYDLLSAASGARSNLTTAMLSFGLVSDEFALVAGMSGMLDRL